MFVGSCLYRKLSQRFTAIEPFGGGGPFGPSPGQAVSIVKCCKKLKLVGVSNLLFVMRQLIPLCLPLCSSFIIEMDTIYSYTIRNHTFIFIRVVSFIPQQLWPHDLQPATAWDLLLHLLWFIITFVMIYYYICYYDLGLMPVCGAGCRKLQPNLALLPYVFVS